MTLGTGISQADRADLDKALKGKFIIPLNVRRRVVQCECDCQFSHFSH